MLIIDLLKRGERRGLFRLLYSDRAILNHLRPIMTKTTVRDAVYYYTTWTGQGDLVKNFVDEFLGPNNLYVLVSALEEGLVKELVEYP